ncbi:potassium-transporting ATPase subunit KdpC [Roseomonas sp. NAR14]|uniref:Potassium-transporting ATPase KdpC subunit n=1 Tax=Roseomonas acroporae TaxID=2937791 RepID=A0A9X1YA03_9PROT|nr:potassium-transporting ATPase subunit KdpC [Roseomonas acroporae]MCK8786291.1 potassium-transporting ATPase subunit KdpC [Roseomonas acroporae]
MAAILRPTLTLVLGATLLLGVAAPLAVTGLAQAVMPGRANGGLIERDGTVVGAGPIGQSFTGARWFHGRPSATTESDPAHPGQTRAAPYNASASAASQLGPTSKALLDAVTERVAAAGGAGGDPVPADAATASGSGLDPHISPANARRQVARVAAARGLDPARVAALVEAGTEGREFGLLGEPRVNVLRLNLALDALR